MLTTRQKIKIHVLCAAGQTLAFSSVLHQRRRGEVTSGVTSPPESRIIAVHVLVHVTDWACQGSQYFLACFFL